jgi:hypothetical protein
MSKAQSSSTPLEWANNHAVEYGKVLFRLGDVRSIMMQGSTEAAVEVIRRSYINSVLSIRTNVERHEQAFVGYFSGDMTLDEAAGTTVFGNNKTKWIEEGLRSTAWRDLIEGIRSGIEDGELASVLELVVTTLKGVSYRKGAFTLAMCGFHEFMCIDSHVASYAGLEQTESNRLEFTDARAYLDECQRIIDDSQVPYPPFIVQWVIFDLDRGEHSPHMAFFREVLPDRVLDV